MRFALALLLACPVVAATAEEAAKTLLRYKFQPGEVLRWEVDQRMSVRNTMKGASEEAESKTVSLKAWKVVDVMPNGEIEFNNLVERLRMENQLPDRATMTYDSTKAEDAPPGFEDAARAVGVILSAIRMSPRGEVIDRDIKHHQPAADPHEQIVLLLPEEPVAAGDSWTQDSEINVPVGDGQKRIKARRKHTLKSVKAGVATIATEFQVLSPTTPELEGRLAHRMVKGEIRFDIQKGRVIAQRLNVDRRVLGFAGPASSMHLITRHEEKLQDAPTAVASRP